MNQHLFYLKDNSNTPLIVISRKNFNSPSQPLVTWVIGDGVTENKLFILIGFWKFRIILTSLRDVIIQSRDGDVSRNIPIRGVKIRSRLILSDEFES